MRKSSLLETRNIYERNLKNAIKKSIHGNSSNSKLLRKISRLQKKLTDTNRKIAREFVTESKLELSQVLNKQAQEIDLSTSTSSSSTDVFLSQVERSVFISLATRKPLSL